MIANYDLNRKMGSLGLYVEKTKNVISNIIGKVYDFIKSPAGEAVAGYAIGSSSMLWQLNALMRIEQGIPVATMEAYLSLSLKQ